VGNGEFNADITTGCCGETSRPLEPLKLEEDKMPDITAITSVITSLKAATDIAKFFRESDFSIEKAEMKLKLAELMSSLADAKIQMAEVHDVISERERRIQELEEAFQSKGNIMKCRDAYYDIDEDGKPNGEPYCSYCWEVNHKKYHLQLDSQDRHTKVCICCKNKYQARMVCQMNHGKFPGEE
jgi:hypothetical protein